MPTAQQLQAAGSTVVHPEVAAEVVAVQSPYASFQASQLGAIELTAPSSIHLALIWFNQGVGATPQQGSREALQITWWVISISLPMAIISHCIRTLRLAWIQVVILVPLQGATVGVVVTKGLVNSVPSARTFSRANRVGSSTPRQIIHLGCNHRRTMVLVAQTSWISQLQQLTANQTTRSSSNSAISLPMATALWSSATTRTDSDNLSITSSLNSTSAFSAKTSHPVSPLSLSWTARPSWSWPTIKAKRPCSSCPHLQKTLISIWAPFATLCLHRIRSSMATYFSLSSKISA